MTEIPPRSVPEPVAELPGEPGRVALLSDIHGNLPALEAVLAELDGERVDAICLLGDVTWGPQPLEVLDRLAALAVPVHAVRGNAERALLELAAGQIQPDRATDEWMVAAHGAAGLAAVAAYPRSARLRVAGFGTLRLCHGSPRSDIELLTAATDPAKVRASAAGLVEERGFAHGHTHVQYQQELDGLLVIAPGSVGLGYGIRAGDAQWAMLDGGGLELRTTRYDVEAAVAAARDVGYPLLEVLLEMLRTPADLAEVEADAVERGGFSD